MAKNIEGNTCNLNMNQDSEDDIQGSVTFTNIGSYLEGVILIVLWEFGFESSVLTFSPSPRPQSECWLINTDDITQKQLSGISLWLQSFPLQYREDGVWHLGASSQTETYGCKHSTPTTISTRVLKGVNIENVTWKLDVQI